MIEGNFNFMSYNIIKANYIINTHNNQLQFPVCNQYWSIEGMYFCMAAV